MFCDSCGRNAPCGVELRERTVSIRGTPIPVQYQAHICGMCGEEVYDEAIEAHIMDIARSAYRKKERMLPAERLRAYMRANGISNAEMAERAGCAVAEIVAATTGRLLDAKADAKLKKAVGQ